jgi:hypothetical protein
MSAESLVCTRADFGKGTKGVRGIWECACHLYADVPMAKVAFRRSAFFSIVPEPAVMVIGLCDIHAGEHFTAVLGAQQSTLEAVLLKRKLMGPSWVTLACPTRVDAGVQVRFSISCIQESPSVVL